MSAPLPAAALPGAGPALPELVGARRVGAGHWRVAVPRDWWTWAGPHGGVLAGLTLAAAGDLAGADAAVRTIEVRFLDQVDAATVDIVATPRRIALGMRVVEVAARQHGQAVWSATAVFARGGPEWSEALVAAPAPRVPPAAACAPLSLPEEIVPLERHLALRHAGGPLPLTGSPATPMLAWLGLTPDVPVDPTVLCVLADALPPGVYPALVSPVPVPTVELVLHFHADLASRPAPSPVLGVQRNVTAHRGWCVDEADLWDDAGRLLAQSRQLRRVLGPLPLRS